MVIHLLKASRGWGVMIDDLLAAGAAALAFGH